MAKAADGTVEREIYIEAPRETVFRFLVEPEKMIQWMGTEATFENRKGGTYRVNVNGQDVARGKVVEVRPPERVVFTWGWEGGETLPPGESLIEIALSAQGVAARCSRWCIAASRSRWSAHTATAGTTTFRALAWRQAAATRDATNGSK